MIRSFWSGICTRNQRIEEVKCNNVDSFYKEWKLPLPPTLQSFFIRQFQWGPSPSSPPPPTRLDFEILLIGLVSGELCLRKLFPSTCVDWICAIHSLILTKPVSSSSKLGHDSNWLLSPLLCNAAHWPLFSLRPPSLRRFNVVFRRFVVWYSVCRLVGHLSCELNQSWNAPIELVPAVNVTLTEKYTDLSRSILYRVCSCIIFLRLQKCAITPSV